MRRVGVYATSRGGAGGSEVSMTFKHALASRGFECLYSSCHSCLVHKHKYFSEAHVCVACDSRYLFGR
jgi:hypothetical protein